MPLPNSASETHQRIRIQRVNQTGVPNPIWLHGTLVPGSYKSDTGQLALAMDFQLANDPPLQLVPLADPTERNIYLDQNGMEWEVLAS